MIRIAKIKNTTSAYEKHTTTETTNRNVSIILYKSRDSNVCRRKTKSSWVTKKYNLQRISRLPSCHMFFLIQDTSQFKWDLPRMNLIFCIINGKNLFWCDIKILIHWSICFGFYLFYSKKIYFNPLVLPQACRMNNMVFMSYICFFLYIPWMLACRDKSSLATDSFNKKREKKNFATFTLCGQVSYIFGKQTDRNSFFGYN